MTSSMMAGERRWASARRGGMTVLGKVAVPKPLNLPSQRLENHGMDPTVEIVPKGTLSWGSRPSSSTSNAWGSSALSPKADGGTSSPSHLSGRPSSGSGTRPSSSCSDRTHEPNSNAWGLSSRPSSASEALTSNQTALAALRPRSAETRLGSSHLSRFAETSSDTSAPWGRTGISEKMGVASSKNDGFSLSSGDFPTLGSEKENLGKSAESQGDYSMNASVTANTWRRDGPQHVEDGMFRPPVENWQGHPPPYLNANIPPQQFDAWHGPPPNHPSGFWYRGPPGGPPYATPLGPGGFPMEPFPYYRPQIPPSVLANSQAVPPPGTGLRGHDSKNGDIYRPNIPDSYVRPGMPMRPDFYPGPVPYEGYYGPPLGYCTSGERHFPFMGMPAGPPVYGRYPGENAPPESANNHARVGLHGPTGRAPMESGLPEDARGPYKVFLKQHNEVDEKWTEDKWEHPLPDNALYYGKGDDPPRKSAQENEWESEDKKNDAIYSDRRILGGDEIFSQNFDNQGRYSSDLRKNRGKAKTVDRSSVRILENAISTFSQAPQVFSGTPKDSTLIRKIEGLNAKARASDWWPDAASTPNVEEQTNRLQVVDAKGNHLRNEAGTGFGRINTTESLGPASREVDSLTAHSSLYSTASSGTTASSTRFNTQDADGRRKKPLGAESIVVSDVTSKPSCDVLPEDPVPSVVAAEKYVINLQEKDEGECLTPTFDPSDCQEQRSKMREIAKQRALQLQKEEEERIREQKAKALAKLQELNRRTQSVDGSTQKTEKPPPSVTIQQEKEECHEPTEKVTVATKSETPTPELDCNPNADVDTESTDLSNATPIEMSENVPVKPTVSHPAGAAAEPKAATKINEGTILRNKRAGNKQRLNSSLGENLTEKSTEAKKNNADVAVDDIAPAELGLLLAHQKRRNNRSSKNKHKSDEMLSVADFVPKETNAEKVSLESGKLQSSQHTRRMPKRQQSNRNAEREAVIWAPVRSDNKKGEAGNGTLPEAVIATEKDDNVLQNYPKSKRAEMERYVPKPIAKEQLAQQNSFDQTVEISQTVNLTIGNIVCTVESGNGNKQSKVRGTWRSSISDPSSNIQETSLKPEVNCTKDKTKVSDDWNACENSDTAEPVSSDVVKDHGVITSRGKRYPFKGQRNVTSAPPEIDQTDKSSNRTTSHWQPKSQVSAFPSQKRNTIKQIATAAEVRNTVKKDSHSRDRVQMPPDHKKDHPVLEEKNEVVVLNLPRQEFKREKKVDSSFRGKPIPQNEQQCFSSGFRKNGNQTNHSGQDNRQIRGSRYEYQPIGQQNYSKSNNLEGPADGSRNTGSRYVDRSRGYMRHGGGNFNNRHGGNVRVDASYD